MSKLSGYDSEAVGFASVKQSTRSETSSGTQTSDFSTTGVGSQTFLSRDCGSMTTPAELNAQNEILHEYPPPGLNEFLRRVVPGVLEQLGQNEREQCSSESDDDEVVTAKLWQDIQIKKESDGSGDQQLSVLSLSWSSAGNSLAVSLGHPQHETWCEHDGLIKVYTTRRAADDKLIHSLDIHEKNCVSVVRYHPSVAALLAYGTTSGEVVLYNMQEAKVGSEMQLTSPAGCHGSRRVSSLQWADSPLCNTFLAMQINSKGKRRGASDQVLISSGSDGTINAWQVNASTQIFQNIVCYSINGSREAPAPDITCFDFCKSFPLRPAELKAPEDIFVVGCKAGTLFLCNMNSEKRVGECTVDPAVEVLPGHGACVLDVAFSAQKPRVFASISADAELRLYDISQALAPLKVIALDGSISCMCWLPPRLAATGGVALRVLDLGSGRPLPIAGLDSRGHVTAMTLTNAGAQASRLAVGNDLCSLQVFELPTRRLAFSADDLDFP